MKKQNISHWLIAAGILALGIALSLLILLRPFQTDPAVPVYRVTFYDREGQMLQTEEVKQGSGAVCNPPHLPGHRFLAWDQEVYTVMEDLEVHPLYQPVEEKKNVVYADSVYACGTDRFCLTPYLGGQVDCSRFTMEIAYDSQLLSYDGMERARRGLSVEDDSERGVLTLTFTADAPIKETTILAELYFVCRQDGAYSTNFPITTRAIYTPKDGEEVYTDSIAYEARLYLVNC